MSIFSGVHVGHLCCVVSIAGSLLQREPEPRRTHCRAPVSPPARHTCNVYTHATCTHSHTHTHTHTHTQTLSPPQPNVALSIMYYYGTSHNINTCNEYTHAHTYTHTHTHTHTQPSPLQLCLKSIYCTVSLQCIVKMQMPADCWRSQPQCNLTCTAALQPYVHNMRCDSQCILWTLACSGAVQ